MATSMEVSAQPRSRRLKVTLTKDRFRLRVLLKASTRTSSQLKDCLMMRRENI